MAPKKIRVQIKISHKAVQRPSADPITGFTHDWTVSVTDVNDGTTIEHFVEKVIFVLHESFHNHRRVVRQPPYSVSESGYASFTFPIEIHFRSPTTLYQSYDYDLALLYKPVTHNHILKDVTFRNPEEEFERRLLRGGGVLMAPEDSKLGQSSSSDKTSSSHHVSHKERERPSFTQPVQTKTFEQHKAPEKKVKKHKKRDRSVSISSTSSSDTSLSISSLSSASSVSKKRHHSKHSATDKKKHKESGQKSSHKSSKKSSDGAKSQKQKSISPSRRSTHSQESKGESNHALDTLMAELSRSDSEDDIKKSRPKEKKSVKRDSEPKEKKRKKDHGEKEVKKEKEKRPKKTEEKEKHKAEKHGDKKSSPDVNGKSSSSKDDKHRSKDGKDRKKSKHKKEKDAKNGEKSQREKHGLKCKSNGAVQSASRAAEHDQMYYSRLVDLQNKLMSCRDRTRLQHVVDLLADTDCWHTTSETFDFDLMKLDRNIVRKIGKFFDT